MFRGRAPFPEQTRRADVGGGAGPEAAGSSRSRIEGQGMAFANERDFSALDGATGAVACAVMAGGGVALALLKLGPVSGHMAVHIASMNVVAPFAAIALVRSDGGRLADAGGK